MWYASTHYFEPSPSPSRADSLLFYNFGTLSAMCLTCLFLQRLVLKSDNPLSFARSHLFHLQVTLFPSLHFFFSYKVSIIPHPNQIKSNQMGSNLCLHRSNGIKGYPKRMSAAFQILPIRNSVRVWYEIGISQPMVNLLLII